MFGKYRVLSTLGTGNSSTVYLAEHIRLNVYRAIKCIPKDTSLVSSPSSEATLLKNLNHPGIPIIYDIEEDEHFFYIIEEFIQGQSIDTFVSYQKISHELLIKFGIQLCDILDYLHHLMPYPILYQDLKPEHIIVCGTQLKLIDFSVASFAAISGKDFNHFGNVDFSAPELISGKPVTLRSDIYSIGKIMEYMMPYLDAATNRSIYPKIQKAISADPDLRYESPQALYSALKEVIETTGRTHLRQTIAVVGSHSGCGATHIAIALVTTLNYLGISAIYQEKNWSNDLRKTVAQLKHVWEKNGCFFYRNFTGFPKYDSGIEIPEPVAQIMVNDYGCDFSFSCLATADHIIYVCGGSLWHRDDAKSKDFLLQNFGNRLHVVANLCDHNSAIYFARTFSQPVYSYPFNTDIFRADKEKLDFVHWLQQPEKGRNRLFLRFINHLFRLLQP